MKNSPRQLEFPVSQKIYGRLLLAYPGSHRAKYGAAMAQLFRDQCRDAWNESPTWGLLMLWVRIFPDLVGTSILERLAALNERKTMSDKLSNLFSFRTTSASIFFTMFALVFMLVFFLSVVITYILPEAYASTARVKVESDAPVLEEQSPAYDPNFIQTTLEIIQSELVLKRVIDVLDLNTKWGKKYSSGGTLKTAESLQILKQRLQLTPIRNTKLIAITAYSDDKNEAAKIANAVAEAYRDYRFESRAMNDKAVIAVLLAEYQNQQVRIQKVQGELDSLRQQLKIQSDASAGQNPQEQPYWDKKRDLGYMLESHQALFSKIEAQKLDLALPKLTLVQITDTAEPSYAPVRPNKTLNIVIGAVAGGFLGLIAGAASVFVAFKFGNRASKNAAPA
jgi:capsular polysaccharide biosynthesis protein